MNTFLKLTFLLIFFTVTLFSQNKKIIKVIDSNLYMLEDSTLIKLAGIDVPSRNQTDEYLEELATDIYFYAYDNFSNRPLEIIYAGEDEQYPGTKLVILNKIFLLSKMNYNSYFLERGFGRFIKNSNSINDSTYLAAETTAKENYFGVWKYTKLNSFGILDRSNSPDGYLTEFINPFKKQFKYDRSLGRILIEVPAGLFGGFICAYVGGAIGGSLSKGNSGFINNEVAIGLLVGYVAGNSLGVYLIAENGNKDLLFGYTLLSSIAATAAIGGLYAALENDNNALGWGILLAPAAGAIIYANTIGYPQEQYTDRSGLDIPNNNNHSSFINSNSIKFNLFRINF